VRFLTIVLLKNADMCVKDTLTSGVASPILQLSPSSHPSESVCGQGQSCWYLLCLAVPEPSL
jgi:hypothetical protein